MDAQQVKTFIDAMAASDLGEMEVGHDGWTLRLVRHPAGVQPQPAARPAPSTSVQPAPAARTAASTPAARANTHEVQAPMFGVLHLQQAPGEPPFVKIGDAIEPGQMLCSIEAMKVFNEVRAELAGRVTAVHAASGGEVESGQPLFTIEQVPHV